MGEKRLDLARHRCEDGSGQYKHFAFEHLRTMLTRTSRTRSNLRLF